jgi:hypothetical protein
MAFFGKSKFTRCLERNETTIESGVLKFLSHEVSLNLALTRLQKWNAPFLAFLFCNCNRKSLIYFTEFSISWVQISNFAHGEISKTRQSLQDQNKGMMIHSDIYTFQPSSNIQALFVLLIPLHKDKFQIGCDSSHFEDVSETWSWLYKSWTRNH